MCFYTRFALEIGVQPESINRIFRKGTQPTFGIIAAAKRKYPALDLNWVVTGEGNMLMDVKEKVDLPALNKTIADLTALIDKKDETIGNLAAALRNMKS
jgi:hypothetical protein